MHRQRPPTQGRSSMNSKTSTSSSASTAQPHHGRPGAGVHTGAMDPDAPNLPAPAAATADEPITTIKHENQPNDTNTAPPPPPLKVSTVAAIPDDERKDQLPLLPDLQEVAFSNPHHSQDLIDLYRLGPTAAKVARIDPVTGDKINKLRSSYANQIKAFQIAGKNKAIKHDDALHGMSLRDMAAWPYEEWQVQKVGAKDVGKGLSSSALAKLEKAVKLEPGTVPKNDEWESILGHEKLKPGSPLETEVKPSHRTKEKMNGHPNGAGQPSGDSDTIRARRTGKRRRYDDESFEGYGEGFVDDDRDDADGLSSDGGGKKKKRRKDINSINSPGGLGGYGMSVQQQSIGRGIGAFGGR